MNSGGMAGVIAREAKRGPANAEHFTTSSRLARGAGPKPGASNALVRGLPFQFRDQGARLAADADGRILWLSSAASVLVESTDALSLNAGRLAGRTRHSDKLLRELLSEALQAEEPVVQLLAVAANDTPELFVEARQISAGGTTLIGLTLRALQRQPESLPDLTRLFGLTQTEQQITRMMLQGHSVTDIADTLNKSVLTVRTHVKHTYVKLNVSSKEQLFATILKLMID